MDTVVVSVRVKKETKTKLEKEGINVEKEVKEFLANKAAQIELRKTVAKLAQIIDKEVKPSKKGFSVNFIRRDRRAGH